MLNIGERNPVSKILMGPGPSTVSPRVLRALAEPTLGHLDPDFLKIMNEVMEMLRYVFNTKNQLTMPMSGTGSSGMETTFVNILEPGDKAIIGRHSCKYFLAVTVSMDTRLRRYDDFLRDHQH